MLPSTEEMKMRRMVNNLFGKTPMTPKGLKNHLISERPHNLTQRLHNRRSVHDNYRTGHHKMGNARFK